MNLAFVIGGAHLSGAEKRFCRVAKLLKNQGQDISLIVLYKLYEELVNNPEFKEFIAQIQEAGRLQLVDRSQSFSRLKMVSAAVTAKADILHVCLLSSEYVFLISLFKKVVYEFTSPDDVTIGCANFFKSLCFGLCWRLVTVSVTVGNRLQQYIGGLYPWFEKKIRIFDLPFVEQKYLQTEDISIVKENIVVFAHRLIKRKNPEIYLQAIIPLAKERPEWRFLLLGRGPLEEVLKKQVLDLYAPENVLIAFEPDLPALLRRSRVFVSLIEPDNFPSQSVIEAMASQNALLLSKTGKSQVFLENNGAFTELDVAEVKTNLKALIDSPHLTIMQSESAKLVKNRFSTSAYLNCWMKTYE